MTVLKNESNFSVLFLVFYFLKILSTRLDNLLSEKENLEKKYDAFQREVKHSSLADTAKEIKVLKKVIKTLEVMFSI